MKAERKEERHSEYVDVLGALDLCGEGAILMEKAWIKEEKKKEARAKRDKRKN